MPNTVAPGKRPFHTLIPGFVTRAVDGREQPYMSFGRMGGGVQAQGHVQLLLNHFVFGIDVQAANDAPRFRHYDGQRMALEAPVGDSVRAALAAMGHVLIDQPTIAFGGAQAIVRLPKGFAAGSDPPKDGMPWAIDRRADVCPGTKPKWRPYFRFIAQRASCPLQIR
ncbi:MAG: gamma-glutamyltransferase [Gemmatimonadaceae bacterium]